MSLKTILYSFSESKTYTKVGVVWGAAGVVFGFIGLGHFIPALFALAGLVLAGYGKSLAE